MTTSLLNELLKLRQQLDTIIHTCELQEAPTDVVSELHAAAQQHPNPAPAAELIRTIQQRLPYGLREISQLLQVHGYRRQRTAAGNVYWRP